MNPLNISLCNIPVTPNKRAIAKQPSPQLTPDLSSKIAKKRDNTGEIILVIFFLITKTSQMYVFF